MHLSKFLGEKSCLHPHISGTNDFLQLVKEIVQTPPPQKRHIDENNGSIYPLPSYVVWKLEKRRMRCQQPLLIQLQEKEGSHQHVLNRLTLKLESTFVPSTNLTDESSMSLLVSWSQSQKHSNPPTLEQFFNYCLEYLSIFKISQGRKSL